MVAETGRLALVESGRPHFNDARDQLFGALRSCLEWSTHVSPIKSGGVTGPGVARGQSMIRRWLIRPRSSAAPLSQRSQPASRFGGRSSTNLVWRFRAPPLSCEEVTPSWRQPRLLPTEPSCWRPLSDRHSLITEGIFFPGQPVLSGVSVPRSRRLQDRGFQVAPDQGRHPGLQRHQSLQPARGLRRARHASVRFVHK